MNRRPSNLDLSVDITVAPKITFCVPEAADLEGARPTNEYLRCIRS